MNLTSPEGEEAAPASSNQPASSKVTNKMETMCLDTFMLGEEIRGLVPPVHQQQWPWIGLSPSQLERSQPCSSKTASGTGDGLLPSPTLQV